jgi:hypothetical protein
MAREENGDMSMAASSKASLRKQNILKQAKRNMRIRTK